ncbi:sugar kinase [Faecalicatena contorta]|uniref:Sugar or nucleoside kinase, ribokinase family n=1 Tax=Faecalicatena contorta TaxID=39482 RepID=A0A316A3G7_9FIRM|nr:sugar kinase [Faecalicatena contorta]PWJ51284.1 sugar/nucleoside kinase (ribokinase family) [Faecalicatena contorta]SUQ12840.1 Sugar or nucleoside kinase, ribokinase family [Faecalicatena contorta]
MAEIWTMGEALVEVMRTEVNKPLNETALFRGPFPSGSSSIMISTVARMGHSCGIISGVGKDGFGECLLDRLNKDGVDTSKVLVDPDGSTACAFVSYDDEGERKFIFHWDDTPATKAKMPDVTEPSLKDAKFLHIMGCALTARLSYGWEIVNTARAMKEQGTKISFDPNVRVEHLTNSNKSKESFEIINAVLEMTNVFAPGIDELKLLTGTEDVEEAVKKCFENSNLEILFLKRGSDGSRIYTRDGQVIEQGLYKVEAVDPTGAGDTSIGAFLCALLEEKDMKECAEIAAAAGALNVAAFGPMEGKISPENVQAMRNGTFKA